GGAGRLWPGAGPSAPTPRRTEADRVSPPATTKARPSASVANSATRSGGAVTTSRSSASGAKTSSVHASSGRPESRATALGSPRPSRAPLPAAPMSPTKRPKLSRSRAAASGGPFGSRSDAEDQMARVRGKSVLEVLDDPIADLRQGGIHLLGRIALPVGPPIRDPEPVSPQFLE